MDFMLHAEPLSGRSPVGLLPESIYLSRQYRQMQSTSSIRLQGNYWGRRSTAGQIYYVHSAIFLSLKLNIPGRNKAWGTKLSVHALL